MLVRVLGYDRPHEAGARHELENVDTVVLRRGERDQTARRGRTLTLDVADPRMSGSHAKLTRGEAGWSIEDAGSRNGTFVGAKRVTRTSLSAGDWIELGRTAFLFTTQEPASEPDLTAADLAPAIPEMRTFSSTFARTLDGMARLAFTQQSIVLHGETGTGKEVIAHGLHTASRRRGAFVAVNCGALPSTLVESELFGYRKGAFSGALEDRPGLIRSADGGTLFLDEIADLPLPTQATLLRVLQEGEVLPLGATRPVEVDIRVVAATHRDLEREVEAGKFREDLLARLAGYTLEIPPLRERREDLGLLIAALLARSGNRNVQLTPDAARALLSYPWPRNVRELEQALGSAVALAGNGEIELDLLPVSLRGPSQPVVDDELTGADRRRRDELRNLLAHHKGNVAAVGRALGVARMQVHRWIERYGLSIDDYRRR